MFFTSHEEQRKLETAQFMQDTPGTYNVVSKDLITNKAEYLRCTAMHDEKVVELFTPIKSDILENDLFLSDNVSLQIRMYPSSSKKCINQRPQEGVEFSHVRVQILSAVLYVPRIKLTGVIPKSLAYDGECFKTLTYTHPQSLTKFAKILTTGGQLPKKIAIVLLSESQYIGNYGLHGYYFNHFNIQNVTLRANGKIIPNPTGVNMDFTERNYMIPYDAVFTKLKAVNPLMSHNSYDQGFSLIGFNLTRSGTDNYEKKPKFGTCDVDITFGTPPSENLVVLIYCIYDTTFTIDNHGVYRSELPTLQ